MSTYSAVMSELDNPVLAALNGPQSGFGQVLGAAHRFPDDVAPFMALPSTPTSSDWADAARLVGPGGTAWLIRGPFNAPGSWNVVRTFAGVQMTDVALVAARDPEAVVLGPADVPEMLDLVGRTRPGPFLPRTVELGTYLGFRQHGALVAMAGERLRLPGWTEISAVCTDESVRGQGLGTRLIKAVAAEARAGGNRAFLHAAATNLNAIRLYQGLGFAIRRELVITGVSAPS